MSRRRRNSSSSESEGGELPLSKRVQAEKRYSSARYDGFYDNLNDVSITNRQEISKKDKNYGIPGAFPGLENEDDLFFGPAENGLDYLRMVRSEAANIPSFLTAKEFVTTRHASCSDELNYDDPQKDQKCDEDDGHNENDFSGFWQDNAFIAPATTTNNSQEVRYERAQQSYFDTLLASHKELRQRLTAVPPLDRIVCLTSQQPISFPPNNTQALAKWLSCVKNHDPHPVQVACMDAESIMTLLELVTAKFDGSNAEIGPNELGRLSAWIWAMLARLPDRDVLDGDDIAKIRDLAKAAEHEKSKLYNRNGPYSDDKIDVDLLTTSFAEARARIGRSGVLLEGQQDRIPRIASSEAADLISSSGRSILCDMIFTIIGEVYGQRDLLDCRSLWARDTGLLTPR